MKQRQDLNEYETKTRFEIIWNQYKIWINRKPRQDLNKYETKTRFKFI